MHLAFSFRGVLHDEMTIRCTLCINDRPARAISSGSGPTYKKIPSCIYRIYTDNYVTIFQEVITVSKIEQAKRHTLSYEEADKILQNVLRACELEETHLAISLLQESSYKCKEQKKE